MPKPPGLSHFEENEEIDDLGGGNKFIKNGLFADQTKKIEDMLNEYHQDSVVVKACKHAMDVHFVSMKEDFSRSLRDLDMSDLDAGMKRYMLLLALQKKKYFLQLIESVLTNTDSKTVSLLSNLVSSVHHQLSGHESICKNSKVGSKDKKSGVPTLSLSTWSSSSVVFDLAVASPVYFSFPSDQSIETSEIHSSLAASAIVPNGKKELPVSLEVRTITSYAAVKSSSESNSSKYKLRSLSDERKLQTYSVKILKCYHIAHEQYNSGVQKPVIIGDATVLVSLQPIGIDATEVTPKVEIARAIQENAHPSSINEILDIYSSSSAHSSELIILVRFNTRTCCNNEDPRLVLELTV